MIKALIRYLLPLCFLLVSGYNYMYASSSQAITCHSPISVAEKSVRTHFHLAADHEHLFLRRAAAGTKKIDRLYVEKNEEDTYEVFAGKKITQSSLYLSSAFNSTIHRLFSAISKRSFFYGHFPYYSLSLYITLRVIRI